MSLNPLKAIGSNNIPIKAFNLLINMLSQFTELLNLSFSYGVFPLIYKATKVIPAYKKVQYCNYRPIYLLSDIDKILESNCLYNFLEINNDISGLKFGFRQKHFTSHAVIYLTDKIKEQLDSGNVASGIVVDLQKASGMVDHDIIIQKLNLFAIRSVANDWFPSYVKKDFRILLYIVSVPVLNSSVFAVVSLKVLF